MFPIVAKNINGKGEGVVASRNLEHNELVMRCAPLVAVVSSHLARKRLHLFIKAFNIMFISGAQVVFA